MPVIRITKYFSFEAAHILMNYDGPCKNIHGHSYRLAVTVKGIPQKAAQSPKEGMVMDFGDIKNLVKKYIIDEFDHSLILNKGDFLDQAEKLELVTGKVNWVNYQPTCENLLSDFASRINKRLPEGTELFSLKLHETETSYAEWYAEDNL